MVGLVSASVLTSVAYAEVVFPGKEAGKASVQVDRMEMTLSNQLLKATFSTQPFGLVSVEKRMGLRLFSL